MTAAAEASIRAVGPDGVPAGPKPNIRLYVRDSASRAAEVQRLRDLLDMLGRQDSYFVGYYAGGGSDFARLHRGDPDGRVTVDPDGDWDWDVWWLPFDGVIAIATHAAFPDFVAPADLTWFLDSPPASMISHLFPSAGG